MRRHSCLRTVLGVLLFCLSMVLLAGSLWKLSSVLKGWTDVIDGAGWKGAKDDSNELAICCEAMEKYLSSQWEVQNPNLLYYRTGEEAVENALGLLWEGGEETLSGDARILYQKLLYCKRMRELGKQLPDYESLLSEFGGTLQQIREVCYVSCLRDSEDIHSYLKWLGELPAVLEEMMARLERQLEFKDFYAAESIAGCRLLCEELGGKQGLLYVEFQEELVGCGFLTEAEQWELLSEGEGLIGKVTYVLERLEEYLGELPGAEYSSGLCNYPEGAAYYDYLLECNTGAGMDAEEMYQYLDDARMKIQLAEEETEHGQRDEGDIIPGEWGELLNELYRHTLNRFPRTKEVSWTVSKLPDAFFGRVAGALYRKEGAENFIYVGERFSEESALAAYRILAHEGFPGHAYSSNVDRQVSWPALDSALTFQGYTEGWAVWAEFAAAEWLAEDQEEYQKIVSGNLYDEIVLSQMDIGINGLGWSVQELEEFVVSVYGEDGKGVAASMWNVLADNPGIYQAYTVGYLKVKELEEWCMEQDMEMEEFVSLYQRWGQAPFALMREWMQRRAEDE